jgi:hypothetical protein
LADANSYCFIQIVDLVRKAMHLALTPENDPGKEELKQLQAQLEDINKLAHKQVRRILWSGLGFLITQVGLFFRLTFWEFSWDVMEPITFFTTTTGLVVGYAYFLITARDPTYRDFMERMFESRQRKLIQRQNFNLEKYLELWRRCAARPTLTWLISMSYPSTNDNIHHCFITSFILWERSLLAKVTGVSCTCEIDPLPLPGTFPSVFSYANV